MMSWYIDSSCIVLNGTRRAMTLFRLLIGLSLSEEPLGVPDRVRERVDFVVRVVDVEGSPRRGLDPQGPVQRPGAVVPGPHRHPQLVQDLADVLRVPPVALERPRPAAVLGSVRPDDAHAPDLPQRVQRVR